MNHDNLKSFGGHLECTECGFKQPLGNTTNKMNNGWPVCCGLTMHWYTQKELDAVSK